MATLIKNYRNEIIAETVIMVLEKCCNCGIPFMIPDYHQSRLRQTKEHFYCPNGHGQFYNGPTEAQKLKEQLERERREANRQYELRMEELEIECKRRKEAERKLKRVHAGVCPCCNRSFTNLKSHIETKHPELKENNALPPIKKRGRPKKESI